MHTAWGSSHQLLGTGVACKQVVGGWEEEFGNVLGGATGSGHRRFSGIQVELQAAGVLGGVRRMSGRSLTHDWCKTGQGYR